MVKKPVCLINRVISVLARFNRTDILDDKSKSVSLK